nr:MAG TPA: hypothetical protein [Caudoviricetes sp.]
MRITSFSRPAMGCPIARVTHGDAFGRLAEAVRPCQLPTAASGGQMLKQAGHTGPDRLHRLGPLRVMRT